MPTSPTSGACIRWQRGLAVAGRGSLLLGFLPPFWVGGAVALGSARSSTTWRSATTSCTASTTGRAIRRSTPRTLRVGHRLPRRPLAPLAQPPAPHLHQHPRQGPRHRLRRCCASAPTSRGTRSTWATRWPPRSSPLGFDHWGVMLHDVEVDRILAGKKSWREALADAAGPVLPQVRPAGAEGLRALPAAHRPAVRLDAARQRHRQRDPQRVGVHDHLLRPLPRRRARVHRGGVRGRVRAATGTSARCWARPTSPAAGCSTCCRGNLSHQIEHHLFPDLPARRYAADRPGGAGGVRALRPALQHRA